MVSGKKKLIENWIPYAKGLCEKEEVLLIASYTGMSVWEVTGRLMKFWSFCDSNYCPNKNGQMSVKKGIFVHHIEDACPTEFREAMQKCDWLVDAGDHYVIPNADRFLGESAKKRMKDAERKRLERGENPEKNNKNGPKPQKKNCPKNVQTEMDKKRKVNGLREREREREINPPNPPPGEAAVGSGRGGNSPRKATDPWEEVRRRFANDPPDYREASEMFRKAGLYRTDLDRWWDEKVASFWTVNGHPIRDWRKTLTSYLENRARKATQTDDD